MTRCYDPGAAADAGLRAGIAAPPDAVGVAEAIELIAGLAAGLQLAELPPLPPEVEALARRGPRRRLRPQARRGPKA